MKEEFNPFEKIIIMSILFAVPILIFSAGMVLLFQTNFSKDGIIMSIFLFAFSISSFFALNLHQVVREIIAPSSKCSQSNAGEKSK